MHGHNNTHLCGVASLNIIFSRQQHFFSLRHFWILTACSIIRWQSPTLSNRPMEGSNAFPLAGKSKNKSTSTKQANLFLESNRYYSIFLIVSLFFYECMSPSLFSFPLSTIMWRRMVSILRVSTLPILCRPLEPR